MNKKKTVQFCRLKYTKGEPYDLSHHSGRHVLLPAWARALAQASPGMSAAAAHQSHAHHVPGHGPLMAVGIALASDVLASAVSAYTYHKTRT